MIVCLLFTDLGVKHMRGIGKHTRQGSAGICLTVRYGRLRVLGTDTLPLLCSLCLGRFVCKARRCHESFRGNKTSEGASTKSGQDRSNAQMGTS